MPENLLTNGILLRMTIIIHETINIEIVNIKKHNAICIPVNNKLTTIKNTYTQIVMILLVENILNFFMDK